MKHPGLALVSSCLVCWLVGCGHSGRAALTSVTISDVSWFGTIGPVYSLQRDGTSIALVRIDPPSAKTLTSPPGDPFAVLIDAQIDQDAIERVLNELSRLALDEHYVPARDGVIMAVTTQREDGTVAISNVMLGLDDSKSWDNQAHGSYRAIRVVQRQFAEALRRFERSELKPIRELSRSEFRQAIQELLPESDKDGDA